VKLRTIGLALLASAFMTSAALAQSGTMQPIPNPPEKAKMKHKHKAKAKPAASADAAATDTAKKDDKAAMPAKK
jgi:hypothetical protein